MKQYVLTAAAVKANRAIEQSANGPSSANLTLITFKNGKNKWIRFNVNQTHSTFEFISIRKRKVLLKSKRRGNEIDGHV